MDSEKISIIIPALNEEKLIQQNLQQFDEKLKKVHNLEIIVSDGGSNDKTLDLVDHTVDKVINHNENFKQNIARGRNQGAKSSLGDVLIFLNADTLISDVDDFLKSVKIIFKNESVIAATCPVRIFPQEEIIADRIFHFCYNYYVRLLNKFFMGMGRGECHVIRRRDYFKAGGYNEKLAAGEDFELFKRLRKTGKIKFLKNCLIYESPRRYRKFGYLKVFWEWTLNSVSIFLLKRSISKDWQEIR